MLHAVNILGANSGLVGLFDEATQEFCVQAGIGRGTDLIGLRLKNTEGIVGHVYQTKQIQQIQNYDTWENRVRDPRLDSVGNAIAVPLLVDGRMIGAIAINYTENNRSLRESEKQILALFSSLAAIAIDRSIASDRIDFEFHERLKAQEKLEQFRMLCDAAKDIIFIADGNGYLSYLNPYGIEKLCVSSIFSHKIEDFISEESASDFFLVKQALDKNQMWHGELLLKTSQNVRIPVSFSVVAHKDEQNIFHFSSVIARNVEEQKNAESLLLRQSQLLEQVSESIITTDLGGTIQYWNRAAENLFGFTRSEVIGKNASTIFDSSKSGIITETLFRAASAGTDSVEFTVITSDCSIPIHLKISHLHDDANDAIGFIWFAVDLRQKEQARHLLSQYEQIRAKTILLNRIIDGSVLREEIDSLSLRYGINYQINYGLCIFGVRHSKSSDPQFDKAFSSQALLSITEIPGIFAWERDDEILIINTLLVEHKNISEFRDAFFSRIYEEITRCFSSLYNGATLPVFALGFSADSCEFHDLQNSFVEARQAMLFGVLSGKGGTHSFSSIGVFQLLKPLSPESMNNFAKTILKKLHQEDAKLSDPFYIKTLRALLDIVSIREVAKELYVHPKTVLFRKKRIEQILGTSTDHAEQRLALKMALEWSDRKHRTHSLKLQ